MAFVGIQIKNTPHVFSLIRVYFNEASAINADVFVAIGRDIRKQPRLNTSLNPFADIDGHLLGIKARHIGQHPPHHAACGCVFGGLGGVDDGNTVISLKPFKLHVIKQIASSAVYLVKQHRINGLGILFDVGKHVFERLAFSFLAGGFGNTEQLDDGAAAFICPAFKGFYLDIEREALTLLLTARHTGQSDKSLSGGNIVISRDFGGLGTAHLTPPTTDSSRGPACR